MKKFSMLLLVLAITVACLPGTAHANLLTNPGMDPANPGTNENVLPGWTMWTTGGAWRNVWELGEEWGTGNDPEDINDNYIIGPNEVHDGNFVEHGNWNYWGSMQYQAGIPANVGELYTISAYIRDGWWDGVNDVDITSNFMKIEFRNAGGGVVPAGEYKPITTISGDWKEYKESMFAPAGTVQITASFLSFWSYTDVWFDDANFVTGGGGVITNCDAARFVIDDWEPYDGDYNVDCIVDFRDVAYLGEEWADCRLLACP